MTKRKTPSGLGPAGARFWRETTRKYELRPDEERILLDAAHEIDLIDTLAEAMKDAPLSVRGSQGQSVINPVIPELRQHRATLASLFKQLALPDEEMPEGAKPRSVSARSAANKRWGKP